MKPLPVKLMESLDAFRKKWFQASTVSLWRTVVWGTRAKHLTKEIITYYLWALSKR